MTLTGIRSEGGMESAHGCRRMFDPENDPLRREIALVRKELRRVQAAGGGASAEHLQAELLDLIEQLNGWSGY